MNPFFDAAFISGSGHDQKKKKGKKVGQKKKKKRETK